MSDPIHTTHPSDPWVANSCRSLCTPLSSGGAVFVGCIPGYRVRQTNARSADEDRTNVRQDFISLKVYYWSNNINELGLL